MYILLQLEAYYSARFLGSIIFMVFMGRP